MCKVEETDELEIKSLKFVYGESDFMYEFKSLIGNILHFLDMQNKYWSNDKAIRLWKDIIKRDIMDIVDMVIPISDEKYNIIVYNNPDW